MLILALIFVYGQSKFQLMATLGDTNYQTYLEKNVREKTDLLGVNKTQFQFGAFRVKRIDPITDPETNITYTEDNLD